MAVPIINARTIRNGWGVNFSPTDGSPATLANCLNYLNTRWQRNDIFNTTSTGSYPPNNLNALQAAMVTNGMPDPNLKFECILTAYETDIPQWNWTNSQTFLNQALTLTTPNGNKLFACIEGPNELGCADVCSVIPNATTTFTDDTGSSGPIAAGAFNDWCQALGTYRTNNPTLFTGVEVISPTILYYSASAIASVLTHGGNANFMNNSTAVDYTTFHEYFAGGADNSIPDGPGASGAGASLTALQNAFASAVAPGKNVVLSETSGGGSSMASDGYSTMRLLLLTIMDHFATGNGHRVMVYQLLEDGSGFGIYQSNLTTPKPQAMALANLGNIMSLGNQYSLASNFTDTATFAPTYSGADLTVTGLTNPGSAGSLMILPKSDGSTVIAVWNEQSPNDNNTGGTTSPTITATPVTVNFGSSQTYNVFDPTGNAGSGANTASKMTLPLTPFLTGTGTSVNLNLHNVPLFIEFPGSVATSVPGSVAITAGLTTATTQTLNWTTASQSPTDYIITIQELTTTNAVTFPAVGFASTDGVENALATAANQPNNIWPSTTNYNNYQGSWTTWTTVSGITTGPPYVSLQIAPYPTTVNGGTGITFTPSTFLATAQSYFNLQAQNIASYGQQNILAVALGWEWNSGGINAANSTINGNYWDQTGNQANYIAMWRAWAQAYQTYAPNVIRAWCGNSTHMDSGGTLNDWYPGDDVVDAIGLDAYGSYAQNGAPGGPSTTDVTNDFGWMTVMSGATSLGVNHPAHATGAMTINGISTPIPTGGKKYIVIAEYQDTSAVPTFIQQVMAWATGSAVAGRLLVLNYWNGYVVGSGDLMTTSNGPGTQLVAGCLNHTYNAPYPIPRLS